MDILYLASHDFYDFVWFRPQHIATRLAKRNRVLYVQPTRAMKWRRPMTWNRLVIHSDNLLIYNPIVIPGIRYSRILRRINQWMLKRSIRRLLSAFGMKIDACIIATPFAGEFAGKFRERVTVYDCNDDWSAIPNLPTKHLIKEEEKIIRKADLVFVTSREIYRRIAPRNSNTHLLPSGADVEHFSKCIEGGLTTPEELARLPHPIIGSIGSINGTKDDLDLLNYIVTSRPDWSLVLVGPVATDVDWGKYPALRDRAHFIGKRDYSELPKYLNVFDVCILAYRKNQFTDSVNPTKVFEYLSAGKPVVATPLDDIKGLSSVIRFAGTPGEFVTQIESALGGEDSDEDVNMRVEAGKRVSWDVIVTEFENHLAGTCV